MSARGRRVLLIEADPGMRAMLAYWIRKAGFEPIGVEGPEAIAALDAIDLALCDAAAPFASALAERLTRAEIPLLRRGGPELPGPIDARSLAAALSAALEGEAPEPLRVAVDPDLLDLIPGYLDECRRQLAAMRASLSQNDLRALAVPAHRLRGTGGGYGFDRLTELGGAIEDAAKDGDGAAVEAALAALADFLERVLIEPA